MIKQFIIKTIDVLYIPLLRKYIPLQTFRYAICGGANMLLDMILYVLLFNFVLCKNDITIFDITISAKIAAFLMVFPVTFFVGLWLGRNITFQNSYLTHKTQSVRYLSVVVFNILFKYWGLTFFVDVLYIYPSVSNAVLTVLSIFFSYLLQKNYTFKIKK